MSSFSTGVAYDSDKYAKNPYKIALSAWYEVCFKYGMRSGRFHPAFFSTLLLVLAVTACGPREQIKSYSAEATHSMNTHPLVGAWQSMSTGEDLVIRQNGTSLSQGCGSQGTIGDLAAGSDCGINSKSCGSFPFVVINGNSDPACTSAGSYICYFNVFTISSKDYLGLNCSDSKGTVYYVRTAETE